MPPPLSPSAIESQPEGHSLKKGSLWEGDFWQLLKHDQHTLLILESTSKGVTGKTPSWTAPTFYKNVFKKKRLGASSSHL
jgi:hypothetical protein